MQIVGTLFRLALADFRERTRRYSFLITMLGTLFFGFLVITGKWAVRMGEYRGEYNSAFRGDPVPGIVKQLKVQYRINGKAGEATFQENATVLLSVPE